MLNPLNSGFLRKLYRYDDAVLPNTVLIVYVVIGLMSLVVFYADVQSALGVYWAVLLSVLYRAHLMIIMAYFAHECMHNSIFRRAETNEKMGAFICWLLGAGYHPYQHLKNKHFRHHAERCDVVTLDYRQFLQRHDMLRKVVTLGQRYHLPAAEVLTHILALFSPWIVDEHVQWRKRFLLVFASRVAFFALVASINIQLLVIYWLAYLLCITVLGFMDAYQHTYEIRLTLDQPRSKPQFDRAYEEQHTYSNLLSRKYPVLNLFVLNFCYHNVHHVKSGEPWYRLPAMHRDRYGVNCPQEIAFHDQLQCYHQYREQRITDNDSLDEKQQQAIGAAGVSFLVGV
ncbi:fatty acid desaturase family protein [Aurantivibrio plasticivorans]